MVSTRGSANPARNAARGRSVASTASSRSARQGPPSGSAVSSASSNAARAPAAAAAALPPAVAAAAQPAAVAPVPPAVAALDPAVAAQVHALVAAALAAHVARSENGDSRAEPEVEPDEAEEDEGVADVAKDKKNGRIDTRNIRVKPFDGLIADSDFDSKARDFREELDEQIADAQILACQVWTDDIKKAILKMFLTGAALKWYRDWRASNPAATYADSCDALVHEYRPVLLSVDVASRIKSERKRWNETYRDFADRLLQMADALEGGKTSPANARHALVAFVRNAYAKYSDFLETKTNLESEKPEAELKLAVSILSRKAESDGRLPDKSRSKVTVTATKPPKVKTKFQRPVQRNRTPKKPVDSKKRAAESNAAVVERKKKPKATTTVPGKSGIVCWECGGTGHTQAFHQKFLQPRRVEAAGETKGKALLANEESSADEEMASDGDEDRADDDE